MNPISDFCGGDWTFMPMSVLADRELTPAAKLLYGALCNHTRLAQGRTKSRPSGKTLAEETGLARRHIYETARKLEERGLITITARHRGDGSKAAHEYEVLPPPEVRKTCKVVTTSPTPPRDERSQERTENSKTENNSADKPREPLTENPTPTAKVPPNFSSLGNYEPAEDVVPYRPLARPKSPMSPKYVTLGGEVRTLYRSYVAADGLAPPCASCTPATLVKAGKTVHALKDSRFAGKTLKELMPLLVERIKTCEPFWRKNITFGWLFCANTPNLARLLNGNFDVSAGEVEMPKKREIPINDQYPGMDEEAYWREKDKRG